MASSEQPSESEHNASYYGSAALCEALYVALRQRIPRLERHSNPNYCRLLDRPGHTIAYLRHYKRQRVVVWFRGSTDEERTEGGILIRPRARETYGGFAEFGARFEISDLHQVPSACDIVCQELHPA